MSPGALQYQTNYTLNVTVTHKVNQVATRNVSYTFTTGIAPPVNGTISEVSNGVAMQTPIKLSIANWNYISGTGAPIMVKFRVKGISVASANITSTSTYLTNRAYYQNESVTIKMPMVG